MNRVLRLRKGVISKYEGLLKIQIFGLPHPEWIFINSPFDIPKRPWTEAPHGWTIRCAPKFNYEFGLPARHRLDFRSLRDVIKSFMGKVDDHNFVVYPSWQYDRSGSCHVKIDGVVIEAVIGDIGPLLKGVKSPDTVYTYSGPLFVHMKSVFGEKDILSLSDRVFLLKSCRKVHKDKLIILEWVKTSEKKILFYDWFEFAGVAT